MRLSMSFGENASLGHESLRTTLHKDCSISACLNLLILATSRKQNGAVIPL
jgi:hypothetical protein